MTYSLNSDFISVVFALTCTQYSQILALKGDQNQSCAPDGSKTAFNELKLTTKGLETQCVTLTTQIIHVNRDVLFWSHVQHQ